jgi:PAS domain S-box-containing protein
VLTKVSASIKRAFRPADIVGRVGGDEFLVLLKGAFSRQSLIDRVEQLVESLQFDCFSGERSVSIGVSVGVLLFRADQRDVKTICDLADSALYRAKRAGKSRYHILDDTDEQAEHLPAQSEPVSVKSSVVQLRSLLEYMDGGVLLIEVASELHIIYASPSFYKTTGRREGDETSLGMDFSMHVHPEDQDVLAAHIRSCAADQKPLDYSYRFINVDGSVGWRNMRASLIPYESSPYPVMVAVITNIAGQSEQ